MRRARAEGVANGFTNVVVSKRDGKIELDPHVTGACVLTFDEDEACGLRDLLIVLLGWPAVAGFVAGGAGFNSTSCSGSA